MYCSEWESHYHFGEELLWSTNATSVALGSVMITVAIINVAALVLEIAFVKIVIVQ